MTESWQTTCPRCGTRNSAAYEKCIKCGRPLRRAPGLLVAGQKLGENFPAAASMARPTVMAAEPGGLLGRLIALFLDLVLVATVDVVIYYLWNAQLTPPKIDPNQSLFIQELTQRIALFAGLTLVDLFYFAGSWAILGASPGMLVMNLRVVDSEGRTPSAGRAILRFLVMLVIPGVLVWPISAIIVAISPAKRAIHDALSATLVIQYLDAAKVAAKEARLREQEAAEAARAAAIAPPIGATAPPVEAAPSHPAPSYPSHLQGPGLLPTEPLNTQSDSFPAMAPPPPLSPEAAPYEPPPPPSEYPTASGALPPEFDIDAPTAPPIEPLIPRPADPEPPPIEMFQAQDPAPEDTTAESTAP